MRHMSGVLDEMKKEVAEKTEFETRLKDAERILKLGKLSIEEVAESLNLPVETVMALSEDKSA